MPGSAVETAAAGYRPLLFSIAYGMTGSVGDAEDIVQDAFLGLARARQAGTVIADLKAYLTTAVTRLGISYLSSARVRRERYVGDWLPEPVVVPAGPGPAEHAELALHADGGGKTQAIGKPLAGRQNVTRMLVSLLRRARNMGASIRLAWVNGRPGAVLYDAEGRVVSVMELDTVPNGDGDDVIQTMHAVVNPDKLGHLGPVSDLARLPGQGSHR